MTETTERTGLRERALAAARAKWDRDRQEEERRKPREEPPLISPDDLKRLALETRQKQKTEADASERETNLTSVRTNLRNCLRVEAPEGDDYPLLVGGLLFGARYNGLTLHAPCRGCGVSREVSGGTIHNLNDLGDSLERAEANSHLCPDCYRNRNRRETEGERLVALIQSIAGNAHEEPYDDR